MSVIVYELKEDNTTCSFHLCHLLFVPSVIIKSGTICASVCLYTIIIYTDCMAVYMCQGKLLAIVCQDFFAICMSTAEYI